MSRPFVGIGHLAHRFVWSLSSKPPTPGDEAWLMGYLNDKEAHLYSMMSNQDRRHAIECGQAIVVALGDEATTETIVASALHDVGKTPARLGTGWRVVATILRLAPQPGDSWMHKTHIVGRLRRYNQHSAIGAELLTGAGSEPLVIAWAAEHHVDPAEWTIDRELGIVLAAADGESVPAARP